MKKAITLKLWFLAVLSGVLLSIPFVLPHCGPVSLIALIPLFAAEYIAKQNNVKHFWILYYASFLIWNVIATYWIWYATPGGAVAAIVLNALQMVVIFRVFRWMRSRRSESILPYIGFACMWLCWEHFYFTWQVSWPWLTLGNSFADNIKYIQWYSVTGTLGGSLWILLTNILLFRLLISVVNKEKFVLKLAVLLLLIILPICLSLSLYKGVQKRESSLPKKEVVVLQPNIDPFNIKFSSSQDAQNNILLSLAQEAVTPETFLVAAPETFFNPSKEAGFLNEDTPHNNKTVKRIAEFCAEKNVNFLYGAVTQMTTVSPVQPGPYARPAGYNYWSNVFNTAVFNTTDGRVFFYHKSKLVIMAESVPMFNNKPLFESLGIDLGGEVGFFTPQSFRDVFKTSDGVLFGSAICYESVFGDFYRDYIKNGAEFMTIITNDGWWKNTPGHIQHLNYARLRAIETRRYIARSANTGISAIIDAAGEIVERTPWWEPCYIRGEIALNKEITPFVKYGDVTGVAAAWCALAALLLTLLSYFFKKR